MESFLKIRFLKPNLFSYSPQCDLYQFPIQIQGWTKAFVEIQSKGHSHTLWGALPLTDSYDKNKDSSTITQNTQTSHHCTYQTTGSSLGPRGPLLGCGRHVGQVNMTLDTKLGIFGARIQQVESVHSWSTQLHMWHVSRYSSIVNLILQFTHRTVLHKFPWAFIIVITVYGVNWQQRKVND